MIMMSVCVRERERLERKFLLILIENFLKDFERKFSRREIERNSIGKK